jgi:uncharacterized protein with ParB-like and HNH nuclease domain
MSSTAHPGNNGIKGIILLWHLDSHDSAIKRLPRAKSSTYSMKITCLDKQVGQFLKESFYRIPRFQRPYSWDRTNIEEFWNDAVVENEAQYFIGSFVVYDDKTAMGVVDGQQRLTTITLLLCALRNAFEQEGFLNLAKGVHGIIERTDISDQRFYILQTETSYPYLQEHIQKFGDKPGAGSDAGPEE